MFASLMTLRQRSMSLRMVAANSSGELATVSTWIVKWRSRMSAKSSLRRDGALSLRNPGLELVLDRVVSGVRLRRRFSVFLFRHVAVELEPVPVGIVEVDALGDPVIDGVVDRHVVFLENAPRVLQLG